MPSLRIRALPQSADADIPATMVELRDHLARILAVPAARVRVLWHTLEPGHYLQGDGTPSAQPHDTHPPTGELIAFEGRSDAQVEEALEAVAATLTQRLGLAEGNAWVSYVEAPVGHLYVDGAIKRS